MSVIDLRCVVRSRVRPRPEPRGDRTGVHRALVRIGSLGAGEQGQLPAGPRRRAGRAPSGAVHGRPGAGHLRLRSRCARTPRRRRGQHRQDGPVQGRVLRPGGEAGQQCGGGQGRVRAAEHAELVHRDAGRLRAGAELRPDSCEAAAVPGRGRHRLLLRRVRQLRRERRLPALQGRPVVTPVPRGPPAARRHAQGDLERPRSRSTPRGGRRV